MPMKWVLAIVGFLVAGVVTAEVRTDYRAVMGELPDGRVAWRAWTQAEGPRLLVVDPATLAVTVVPGTADQLQPRSPGTTPWDRWRTAADRTARPDIGTESQSKPAPLPNREWRKGSTCAVLEMRELCRTEILQAEICLGRSPVYDQQR